MSRFHNKWHRHNHHTNATTDSRYPDSSHDPIASQTTPFQGTFVTQGSLSSVTTTETQGIYISHPTMALSALGNVNISGYTQIGGSLSAVGSAIIGGRALISGNTQIGGNLSISGNLSAAGSITYLDTIVTITSALSVTNTGSGPALTVVQTGGLPIAIFEDNVGAIALYIEGTNSAPGWVGIGTPAPNKALTVIGSISSTNYVYASAFQTSAYNDTQWSNAFTTISALSGKWNSVYTSVNLLSSTWYNTANTVSALSANWSNAYATVSSLSGNWQTVYSTVNSLSSLWSPASLSNSGVVSTSAQSFSGDKLFSGNTTFGTTSSSTVLVTGSLSSKSINTGYIACSAAYAYILGNVLALPNTANVLLLSGNSPVNSITGGSLGTTYFLINSSSAALTFTNSLNLYCRGNANLVLSLSSDSATLICRGPTTASIH